MDQVNPLLIRTNSTDGFHLLSRFDDPTFPVTEIRNALSIAILIEPNMPQQLVYIVLHGNPPSIAQRWAQRYV